MGGNLIIIVKIYKIRINNKDEDAFDLKLEKIDLEERKKIFKKFLYLIKDKNIKYIHCNILNYSDIFKKYSWLKLQSHSGYVKK